MSIEDIIKEAEIEVANGDIYCMHCGDPIDDYMDNLIIGEEWESYHTVCLTIVYNKEMGYK